MPAGNDAACEEKVANSQSRRTSRDGLAALSLLLRAHDPHQGVRALGLLAAIRYHSAVGQQALCEA